MQRLLIQVSYLSGLSSHFLLCLCLFKDVGCFAGYSFPTCPLWLIKCCTGFIRLDRNLAEQRPFDLDKSLWNPSLINEDFLSGSELDSSLSCSLLFLLKCLPAGHLEFAWWKKKKGVNILPELSSAFWETVLILFDGKEIGSHVVLVQKKIGVKFSRALVLFSLTRRVAKSRS